VKNSQKDYVDEKYCFYVERLLQAKAKSVIIRALAMVALAGPLAMIDSKLRQARKGATVAIDSCAGMWLVRVATQALPCLPPLIFSFFFYFTVFAFLVS